MGLVPQITLITVVGTLSFTIWVACTTPAKGAAEVEAVSTATAPVVAQRVLSPSDTYPGGIDEH